MRLADADIGCLAGVDERRSSRARPAWAAVEGRSLRILPCVRLGRPPLRALLVVFVGVTASCVGPDRSTAADDLRDELEGLPGVTEATVYYTPQSLEMSESARYIVTVEPDEGAAVACAVVRAFVEGFTATGIDADQASLDVRDTGTPPLPWAFTARPEANADTAEAECVSSQEVRAVPNAYAARGEASSNDRTSRPRMHLRFRGGDGVATPVAGEALARTHMPSYDDLDWDVLIICGESPC